MKSKLLILASCIALASCGGGGQTGGGNAPQVATITVQPTSANLTNSYPATIKGKQDIDIRPMVSGFITRMHVDEGATVRRGQPLFTIDQVQYLSAVEQGKAAVETAKAALGTAQLTYDNKVRLNQKQIISDYDLAMSANQLAQAKAALSQAEATLTYAQKNLSYTVVTAPSDGVVGTIPYRLGALVSPSSVQPLTTVSDNTNMYAYFSLSERELLSLTKGGSSLAEVIKNMPPIQLQLIDGSMYPEAGHVETISGVIDNATGSVSLRALFPNPGKLLRSGGTANVVFPNPLTGIFVIPQSATVEIQDKKFVYVVQPDNTVKNTEITVHNISDGQNYYVLSGLNAGDRICIESVQNLQSGQAITPITKQEKEEIYQKNLQDQKDGNIMSAMQ